MIKYIREHRDDIWFIWLFGCLVIFFTYIATTPFEEAIAGALFFGTLGMPLFGVILAIIDDLFLTRLDK